MSVAADIHGDPFATQLRRWMRETLGNEKWLVAPPHHVVKPPQPISIGMLSHFTYKFSMVALGHLSLYHHLNRDAECPGIADRVLVYDPLAGENGQLQAGLELHEPLSTLERHIPLNELQLICVSLTNPDAITTALNLLRLGGVPWRREERAKGSYPLILAGGPGCCNPEPFADFFDFFCIGDGRTLTAKVVDAIYRLRMQGKQPTTERVSALLPDVKGLYVPSLYRISYANSKVSQISSECAPLRVEPASDPPELWAQSSLVSDGETAVIVPNYGCKHRCSYCQISEVEYQQFGIEPLLERVDQYIACGVSTLIVNSATLTQHSDVRSLLVGIADRVEACARPVKVYIGSVRFDEVSSDILAQIGRLEAFSHTYLLYTNGSPVKFMALAPEHGSRDLMRRMYRPVDPWRILDTVDLAAQQGVHHFVLYFIVGFESEGPEDRREISALTVALLDKIRPAGGTIVLKINPLIPTPGTACQRMAMPTIDEYRGYLTEVTDGIIARIGKQRYEEQVDLVPLPEARLAIEAMINRADRRIGPVIERLAIQRAQGTEPAQQTLEAWAAECGLSRQHLAEARSVDEILPWQVVDRTWIKAERNVLRSIQARAGK